MVSNFIDALNTQSQCKVHLSPQTRSSLVWVWCQPQTFRSAPAGSVSPDRLFLQVIAIVLGFLVFVALIILLVFAVKTRGQIMRWGPERILWEEVKYINSGQKNSVGEWVSSQLVSLT